MYREVGKKAKYNGFIVFIGWFQVFRKRTEVALRQPTKKAQCVRDQALHYALFINKIGVRSLRTFVKRLRTIYASIAATPNHYLVKSYCIRVEGTVFATSTTWIKPRYSSNFSITSAMTSKEPRPYRSRVIDPVGIKGKQH